MTQRELMFLIMGFAFGSLVKQNRKARDVGKERPKEVPWELAIQAFPAGMAALLAGVIAVIDLVLVGGGFRMLMGWGRWEPGVLFAIPIFAVVSGFFAWLAVRLIKRLNRRYFNFDAFSPPPTAHEHGPSKSPVHDLD